MARQEDILQRMMDSFSWRGLLLHPATLFVAASMLVLATAMSLWNQYRHTIINQADYLLTRDKVHLPSPPELCRSDLKALVLEQNDSPTQASLLDPALVSNTVNTFRTVGWVEQVRKIEKSRSGLDIDLVYRTPVGMVELNPTTVPGWPENQTPKLFPIDRYGIIMPGTLAARNDLLRISVFDPAREARLETWSDWPDERVKAAAAIGLIVANDWQAFGLYRIVTFRRPSQTSDASVPFELWPAVGTQVIWGNPPGREVSSEASAQLKLQALKSFVDQMGPLNQLNEQKIDIRSGNVRLVSTSKTAKLKFETHER